MEKDTKDEKLDGSMVLNYMIAMCISADNNYDKESISTNIKVLEAHREYLKRKPEVATSRQRELIEEGIEMLKKELEGYNE